MKKHKSVNSKTKLSTAKQKQACKLVIFID